MTKTEPKISVVVPCYKAEEWLSQCMDSLSEQTFKSFEVILVDDGSPDGTGQLVDDYAARYPYVRAVHQRNGGVTSARRKGVESAVGEWICFVDADDQLPHDALALLYEASGEAYDFVIGFQRPSDVDLVMPVNDLRKHYILGDLIPPAPWGKLIRRELFVRHPEALQIPREIVKGEDMLMNVRLAFATNKPARVIPAHVYQYRNNDESVTHTFRPTVAYEEMYDRFRMASVPPELRDEYFDVCLQSRLTGYVGCLQAGDGSARRSAFRKKLMADVGRSALAVTANERLALRFPGLYMFYRHVRWFVSVVLRRTHLRQRREFR